MSKNGIKGIQQVGGKIKKIIQTEIVSLQKKGKKKQKLETAPQHNTSITKKGGTGKQAQNGKNEGTKNRTFNESELLEQMKRDLDKKYELEQEMARLAGGDTGLVQLRMRLRKAGQESDSGSVLFLEEIFCEKKARLKKKMENHRAIIVGYQKYKGKYGNLDKERIWDDLIWRLTKEDDNERLYQELLQYPCGNEKK